jgi:capsular polysaccharide biosynthesis protein
MDSEFNGKLLSAVLKKYAVWILLSAILFGALAFAYTLTVQPVYSSNSSFYVTNIQSGVEFTQSALVSAAQVLAKGYIEIIKSDRLLIPVSEELNAKYPEYSLSTEKLRKMLSGRVESESEYFEISISCNDPVMAKHILEAVAEKAPRIIDETVKRENCVAMLNHPSEAVYVSPGKVSNTLIGAAIGLVLSFLIFTVIASLDRTVRTEEDLKSRFKVPVLGNIPRWTGRDN